MTPESTFHQLSEQERAAVKWHISTYSENGGAACVEAGVIGDGSGRVAVRHSHHPDGLHLTYTHHAWHTFTTSLRTGDPRT